MKLPAVLLSAALLTLTSACATSSSASDTKADAPASKTSPASELRLGYFANVTHAGPVYGVGSGIYAKDLGSTKLTTQIFNAGPAAVEAIFGGTLDAAYLGPSPAINAFVKSNGEAVRIVSGATSGGASLVVAKGITSPAQLKGKIVASPQTGGTQDVALRTWLAGQGFKTDTRGAGPVTIRSQENSQSLQEFQAGRIAGAWVPEPWASRLVLEGGGHVLVDETSLWPQGKFVTTHLVVRTKYLAEHPQTVEALLRAQVEADEQITAEPAKAEQVVNDQLKALTGKALKPATIDRAFKNITITEDPLATTLRTSAEHGVATGLVKKADLTGIYDLTLLRKVLGHDVDDAGLGASTTTPKG